MLNGWTSERLSTWPMAATLSGRDPGSRSIRGRGGYSDVLDGGGRGSRLELPRPELGLGEGEREGERERESERERERERWIDRRTVAPSNGEDDGGAARGRSYRQTVGTRRR
jgi:hypothetical protein